MEIEKYWIAVDPADRIAARATTRDGVKRQLIREDKDPRHYDIVAVPKTNPPQGVGWG